MADRRPPGFNVPLGFYDGPEVKSIPRRIRAAAVGVWTLCGTFSANKLQDGYVGPEDLKTLCCTDAIRDAMMNTKGPDGAPDPLWVPARDGGIQFTKWVKYQRSRADVKAYREADAERKRTERKASKGGSTSDDSEMSDRTAPGHPPDHRNPQVFETKTDTEDVSYVHQSATVPNARDSVAATPGAELIRELVPPGHPDAVLTVLRIRANELLRKHPRSEVAAAVQLWLDKPSLGPHALPSLLSEVIKSRAAPNGARPSTADQRVAQVQALKSQPSRLEIT